VTPAPEITPLVFVGGSRDSAIEALLADSQEAIAQDLLDRLHALPGFYRPIVATSSPRFARSLVDQDVCVVLDEGEFHFGRSLARLIERFRVEQAFYLGGGSAPLLTSEELSNISRLLAANDRSLVTNNFYSSDFVAFRPAGAIQHITLPAIDNDLAVRLQREANLQNIPLTRSPATQMDVDTPTDLLVLALHPDVGPSLRAFLEQADLDTSRVRATARYLTDPNAEVIVAGRVGSHVLAHLETDLACRTRVFSEERGMRASGREDRGEVRSLLGFHLSAVGPRQFFDDLSKLGDAAFIDSRVVFNHLGLHLTASDRFHSDLLQPETMVDPVARAFTQAALAAPIPVVLGGHSLVAGGLWVLSDAAWRERDRELGLTPR
jgi:2-phospho-L-lactate guanylyltransferase (CobY/MobA/RfbA family)